MDPLTEKFKTKIKKEKDNQDSTESTDAKMAGVATLVNTLVGLSQLTLIFLGYSALSNHYNLTVFSVWEFAAIVLGGASALTFIKNYIKDFFKKS